MRFEYCEGCKSNECDCISAFLKMYNEEFNYSYEIIECPDKKEPGKRGKKPDAILQEKGSQNKIALEVKEIFHSEAKSVKKAETIRAKQANRNELWSLFSYAVQKVIDEFDKKTKYIVELAVYKKIGSEYIEKVIYEHIREHLAEDLVTKDYYIFEDDKVRVEIKESEYGTEIFGEDKQILFLFPAIEEKGRESEGISFDEMFNIGLDYDSIVGKIEEYIKDKCKNKFDEYQSEKRIILLELKFKYGMEIMVDLNKEYEDRGFDLRILNYVFRERCYEELKNYADEVWIMYRDEESAQMIRII